jgi:hypothetical protein
MRSLNVKSLLTVGALSCFIADGALLMSRRGWMGWLSFFVGFALYNWRLKLERR